MNDEAHEGSKNRETWAFNLQWQNDEGLYHMVLDAAESFVLDYASRSDVFAKELVSNEEALNYSLGEYIIDFVKEQADEMLRLVDTNLPGGETSFNFWKSLLDDVGSFWRVDKAEVGAEVRESLVVEEQMPEAEA